MFILKLIAQKYPFFYHTLSVLQKFNNWFKCAAKILWLVQKWCREIKEVKKHCCILADCSHLIMLLISTYKILMLSQTAMKFGEFIYKKNRILVLLPTVIYLILFYTLYIQECVGKSIGALYLRNSLFKIMHPVTIFFF